MLTFVSGWPGPDRDKVVVAHRDPDRPSIYFVDTYSRLPDLLPDAPITDVWRNGSNDFTIASDFSAQFVRIMYDTDNKLILPAISRVLRTDPVGQVIVTWDATRELALLYPELRDRGALLAADGRLNAPDGDHVIFTRGGSFAWTDHLLERQTHSLIGDEELDIGTVNPAFTEFDY